MKSERLRLPIIMLAIGLILMVAVYFLASVQKKPTVTEQDFAYSVTYKVDGEEKTYEGIYTCRFNGFGDNGIDPLTRYYVEEYTVDGVTADTHRYTIAEKDGYTLDIVTIFNNEYLMGEDMGDPSYALEAPVLEAKDGEGNQYDQENLPAAFDAKIVGWEYPEPIKNTFVFAGFSGLYVVNMCGMVLAGLLTLILSMILVRKGDGVVYNALDRIGAVLNFVVALVALPFMTFIVSLVQAYPVGPEWIYQADLCIPPVMALSLVASVSLRRKGFRWSGFLIQFLWIAMLVILAIFEYAT